ncbi:uncharacterized protein Dwil_GK11816 [Drosophila willistoni]|uniref:Ionotropic glutamate receptor C-terminal domain-containing protein n=1 Tax=Drosophila willistoni TaxID=7260 RepID=B4NB23_DROWI|nr:uncharacterized protein LOC6647865 [Drosophila willistoni]EDW80987.2 uncharacterized protein Dwil_GK11816 [Drosophila willistoni]
MYMVMTITNISQPLELSLIRKKSAAKHLSHVFLLVRDAHSVTQAWMRASFRQFWKIWLLNIVIVFWREKRLHIYRYNPFTDNYLIAVDQAEPGHIPTLFELFPKTIPNMQRKPFRMCIYADDVRAFYGSRGEIYGTDGLMAYYLAERLNATMMVTRPQFYRNHNLTSDICFMEVAREFDDVAMNIRFYAPDTFDRQAEATIAHNRDDLCVIVPKAQGAPKFWNIFRSFQLWAWLFILGSVFLAYIFCQIVYRHHNAPLEVGMQLYACTLSLPLSHVPNNYSLRLFLICWLIFGMLICTAFKGNLTSMLVFQPFLPDINRIIDLASSNYRIMVRPRHTKHINHFLTLGHEQEGRIRKLMLEVPEKVLFDHFDENDVSYAYLEKYHIARFQVHARKHTHLGRPYFHLMNSCLVPFHAVYIVPYGSPYLGFLNKLIRSSHEFGFERYWDRIMNAAFIKWGAKVVSRQRHNSNDDPVVLKLEHYQAVFFLWVIGILLASFVFLWEWIIGRIWRGQANAMHIHT